MSAEAKYTASALFHFLFNIKFLHFLLLKIHAQISLSFSDIFFLAPPLSFKVDAATKRTTGKTRAVRIPMLKFPPDAAETKPTRVGPDVQPTSPARARSAKVDVVV